MTAASHKPKDLSRDHVAEWLCERLATRLKTTPDKINRETPFARLGLGSLEAVSIAGDLEDWLERELPPTILWDYPNINDLAAFLVSGDEPVY